MQFTNPAVLTGPVTIDPASVVASVTNPVNTDPASTIAVVTTSVPFLNKDSFFWPAISGEPYAPTFSNAIYTSRLAVPVYENNLIANSFAQSPNMPRIGFNGLKNMQLSGKFIAVRAAAAAGTVLFTLGFSNTAAARFAVLEILSGAAVNTVDVRLRTQAGTTASFAVGIADSVFHDFVMLLSDAGQVTATVDGTGLSTVTADWPSTATDVTPVWHSRSLTAIASTRFDLATPSISWT